MVGVVNHLLSITPNAFWYPYILVIHLLTPSHKLFYLYNILKATVTPPRAPYNRKMEYFGGFFLLFDFLFIPQDFPSAHKKEL